MNEKPPIPWHMRLAQTCLAIVGALGAFFHAHPISGAGTQTPNTDSTEIGWLGFIVFAILLPRIHEFKFFGVSAKVDDAIESADKYKEVLKEATTVLEQWSEAANALAERLAEEDDDATRLSLFETFLKERMGEAKIYLANEPGEDVRIALWVYDPTHSNLYFQYSNEVEPTKSVYAITEGLIGRCFRDQKRINVENVLSAPDYLPTRSVNPPYKSVMCIPVRFGNTRLGVLTVDKPSDKRFKEVPVNVAGALAAQCARALSELVIPTNEGANGSSPS